MMDIARVLRTLRANPRTPHAGKSRPRTPHSVRVAHRAVVAREARTLLVWLALAAMATPAAAQVQVTTSAVVSVVSDEILFAGTTQRTTGVTIGADVLATPFRQTEFHAGVSAGNLIADTPATDGRGWTDIQIGGSVFATSWLAFQLGGDARGYSTPAGNQRWLSISAGAEARAPLFDNSAQAVFRASLLPLVSVTNGMNPNFAVSAATGIRFLRAPLAGAVMLSLEHYSFSNTTLGPHAEQVAMLGLELGVRFPR